MEMWNVKKNCNTKQASYHLDIFETVCFGDKVTCVYIRGFMHYDIIYENNQKMQLCRIVYYSLVALHVLSDIFAHHQEHLNYNYSF